jgi:glyceraldehyde-3-phosphate dehydrogenase/erythrose-4-phosphate dehydrogenase
MTVRAAINGFGRTGRAAFRPALESGALEVGQRVLAPVPARFVDRERCTAGT